MDFDVWIDELDAEAKRRGYKDAPLTKTTGAECWHAAFRDGMTPAEALDADEAQGV